ncbi:MAG TPA: O-antigen ligase family protein [bacterium]|nr:O-antigen ligase family protein [bacterium]
MWQKKIKEIAAWLLYLFVFILPWQTRWIWHEGKINGEYWEWGSFSLYGTEILFWIVLVLTIVGNYRLFVQKDYWKNLWNKYYYVLLGIGALLLFASLSLINAASLPLAAYGLFRLFEMALLVLVLLTLEFRYLYLNLALVAAAVLQVIVALSQWFLQKNVIVSKWLGLAELKAYESGTAVIEYLAFAKTDGFGEGDFWHRWLRAYGSFPHPNALAGFLVVAVLVALGIYLQKSYGWLKLIASLLTSFIFTGLLLTFSRSAWLAFAFGFAILCLFILFFRARTEAEKEQKSDEVFGIIKFVMFVTAITVAFVAVYPHHFYTRTHMETRLEEMSYKDRMWQYKHALNIIPNNLVLGNGIYNYSLYLPTKVVDYQLTKPGGSINVNYNQLVESDFGNRSAMDYQPVHNLYLLVWAELGIFGFLAFVIMLAWHFGLFVYYRRTVLKDKILLVYALSFGAMLLTALFDHYWWMIWSNQILFWMIIALGIKRLHYVLGRAVIASGSEAIS